MLELEVVKVEERIGVKEKGWVLASFIKEMSIESPLLGLKTCLFLRNHANRTVGIPTPVLMRIPQ